MKVMVAVKRVAEDKLPLRLQANGLGVDTAHVKMVMNPFDEIAIEEAVRLKEKGLVNEIIAVSIGEESCQEILRIALARGADRTILVKTSLEISPLTAAKILKAIAVKESPQLIILGKQAVDTDNNQVGQMLAGLLNWSQATFASQLLLQPPTVQVTREVDTGLETLLLKLPAVITTDLRLNEPRYISLPNIMQGKRKPLDVLEAECLQLNLSSHVKILQAALPMRSRRHVKLTSVTELVDRLKNEAKVIS